MEMGALHTWEGIMFLSGVHAARGFHPRSIQVCLFRKNWNNLNHRVEFICNPLPDVQAGFRKGKGTRD